VIGQSQGPIARRTSGSAMGLQVTPQSATNESPFSLVYGADAMIPVEIGEPFLRRELYDLAQNHQNMTTHLDLLPELREKAQICNLAANSERPESITQTYVRDRSQKET